jgi:hypothetical protein
MLSKHEENTMAKLTDPQLIVLSAAGAREDGIAVVPAKMNGAAASKVGASLVTRKLMREVRSKPDMPVWRKGEDDRPISLMITRARSGCDRGREKRAGGSTSAEQQAIRREGCSDQ